MKTEVVVVVLLGLILAILALLSPPGTAFLERVLRESPEARVADYVRAVARGDEEAAMAVWKLPSSLPGGSIEALQERRRTVTHELATRGLRPTFEVVHTEWWSLCCEPHVVDDPRYAGGARMTVRLTAGNGATLTYNFDVFTLGGACWEGDTFCPPRRWALRDVYPAGEEPLFWRAVYRCAPDTGCDVHWLNP